MTTPFSAHWKPHAAGEQCPPTKALSCDEVRARIPTIVIGGTLNGDEGFAWRDHLATCDACAMELIKQRQEQERRDSQPRD